MKINSKSSLSMIELILTITIISSITLYAMIFYKESFSLFFNEYEKEKIKLEFLNTKLFLENNKTEISKLKFDSTTLYFDNSPLLKNLNEYNFKEYSKYYEIELCIENKFCSKLDISK